MDNPSDKDYLIGRRIIAGRAAEEAWIADWGNIYQEIPPPTTEILIERGTKVRQAVYTRYFGKPK